MSQTQYITMQPVMTEAEIAHHFVINI